MELLQAPGLQPSVPANPVPATNLLPAGEAPASNQAAGAQFQEINDNLASLQVNQPVAGANPEGQQIDSQNLLNSFFSSLLQQQHNPDSSAGVQQPASNAAQNSSANQPAQAVP